MIKSKNTCSRLRHRLTLQQEVNTADGAGGYAGTWTNIVDLWAEIIPLIGSGSSNTRNSGKEILFSGQLQAEISYRILLRFQSSLTITPAMRLVYESRIFNIRSVANSSENRETLELLVQEGVPT